MSKDLIKKESTLKFNPYWAYDSLDDPFKHALIKAGIEEEDIVAIQAFLAPLSVKGDEGVFHYEHSLRVGILCARIAQWMLLDPKPLLFAGLLHDIGKALVDPKLLGKTDKWTKKDQKAIEPHVMDGFKLLRGKFDFSAQIIVEHHRFQPCAYPKEPSTMLHPYSHKTEVMIGFYSRLLALADSFDAMHRVNSRGALTGQQIHDKLIEYNPDLAITINNLYSLGIFRKIK
jgi:putative nucleotidyltransferase with HDIG domain